MSLISEQVEARIARAKRAFRQSGRIIDAAKDDLESHTRWLDRHRAAWAEEVKRNFRLLDRKFAVSAFARFAAGAILLLPLALARALGQMAKAIPSGPSPQPRRDETAPRFARRVELQLRIRGLDEPQGTAKEGSPPRARPQIEMPRGWTPPQARRAAFFALAALAQLSKHRIPVSALGVGALLLIAAGAVGATLSSPPAEAPALAAQKSPAPPPHAAPSSIMVQKSRKETERPAPIRGFAVVATAPSFEAPRVPAQTIADLMAMTGPVPLAPIGPKAAAPLAEKPLATKQAAKAKPKRKLAARPPQPLPWWQQWSWMRLR